MGFDDGGDFGDGLDDAGFVVGELDGDEREARLCESARKCASSKALRIDQGHRCSTANDQPTSVLCQTARPPKPQDAHR